MGAKSGMVSQCRHCCEPRAEGGGLILTPGGPRAKVTPMTRKQLKILAVIIAALALVVYAEVVVRVFWKNTPAQIRWRNDGIFREVGEGGIAFAMKPEGRFYYEGTLFETNGQGLRNGEVAVPKPERNTRVLMLGDELVFGPGLAAEETWPAALEAELGEQLTGTEVEVINGGTPGYNFQRSAALAAPLIDRYGPDMVIITIAEDDLELQGAYKGGMMPPLEGPRPALRPGKFAALGNLMLPGSKAPLRFFLANSSHAYLFTALELKGTHTFPPGRGIPVGPATAAESGNRQFDLAAAPVCQAATQIWTPLAARLNELKAAGADPEHGFTLMGVLYSDFHLRGRAALRLIETFERAGVPLMNLSAYRQSEEAEMKERTLGWAPWPNAEAHEENARNLARFIVDRGLVPDAELLGVRPGGGDEYDHLERSRMKLYWDELNVQELEDKVARKTFAEVIDFSSMRTYRKEQVLYGWWPPGDFAWMGMPETALVSGEASVRLAMPPGAEALSVAGHTLRPATAAFGPLPLEFRFECMATNSTYRFVGDDFEVDVPVPEELRDLRTIEVSIRARTVWSPQELGIREDDNRLVSVGIDYIEVK